VGLLLLSPFGLFFASQRQEPGAVPPNGAIAQVNADLAAYLAELQAGDYADFQLDGQLPDWREGLAVFAVRTTLGEDGVDVLTLDPDRVERLKEVFWDMTAITAETVETDAGTVRFLTVEAKTAGEMRELYGFTDEQNDALEVLLAETELLDGLITDLSISQADAADLVEALPEDLDPMRRAVVETACSLVGKVNYWWGGKSLTLGWDDRWGSLRKVTAGGSVTSGQYRPYGLDCSGFVDWVFYNATGGEYVIGHGGGATAQHSYCEPIAWEDALPGDLVFYPEDSHVGVVGGWDDDGQLLVIHCASSYNNTVITGLEGFTSIGRPAYYN
jgi:cell wall-associated NlpC family hydrolase